MTQSIILVVVTALATWFIMRWLKSRPSPAEPLSIEEQEIGRARDIGLQLDGARDRATLVEVDRNRLALAKAVKAALWVTDARLNFAVPELLKQAQRWAGKSSGTGKKTWTPPEGVTQIEGLDDPKSPWAAWRWNEQDWRVEAQWRASILPEEIEGDIGTCKVFVDKDLVLDMTISEDRTVMWIDALTVGPWVSHLLEFAGVQKSDAQARSSERSARKHQDRADKIHWS